MAKEKSKKFWLLFGLIVFVSLNYAVWLNWSENVDRRLKNLESKVDAETLILHEANKISEERHPTTDTVVERYLCVTDNATYFTQIPDQKNCRPDKLPDGWKNLFFSREQTFDYSRKDLSRVGNEVKVWSRIAFNSTQTSGIKQLNGHHVKIEFDELKSLIIFNCSAREYKNPNTVYLLKGKTIHRTSDNLASASPGGHTSYSFGYITEQIEPGTFVDTLYKEVCHKQNPR